MCKKLREKIKQKKQMEASERTKEDIYASIVARIKTLYGGNISNRKANEAARNLIGFCRIITDCKLFSKSK